MPRPTPALRKVMSQPRQFTVQVLRAPRKTKVSGCRGRWLITFSCLSFLFLPSSS